MGLPNISINFSGKASTAIARSSRGIVCLVINETKSTGVSTFKYLDEVDSKDFSENNYAAICDVFKEGCPKLYVVRIGAEQTFADVKAEIDKLKFNWITQIAEDNTDLVAYVKARNLKNPNNQIKVVVFKIDGDDMHIVNFANETVTRINDTTIDGHLFLGRIAGLLATTPFTRSATYYIFDDVKSVKEVEDSDAAVDAGKFVIINDFGEPKVARAVNSLKQLKDGQSEDMKKITVVEAMDLIKEDIASTFKSDYVGKHKNNLDNQHVFIAAVNHYFYELANEQVLDNQYNNVAEIDVAAQRSALIGKGVTEAEDWDDLKVKRNTVGSKVFLKGNVKILDAIEDLEFGITM